MHEAVHIARQGLFLLIHVHASVRPDSGQNPGRWLVPRTSWEGHLGWRVPHGAARFLAHCSSGPVSAPPRLLRSSPHPPQGLSPAYTPWLQRGESTKERTPRLDWAGLLRRTESAGQHHRPLHHVPVVGGPLRRGGQAPGAVAGTWPVSPAAAGGFRGKRKPRLARWRPGPCYIPCYSLPES
jgi:hypothetical protein